jgi:hypothetical protein
VGSNRSFKNYIERHNTPNRQSVALISLSGIRPRD